jgi:hypothetical protein
MRKPLEKRSTKENIDQLEATVDAALEHASHGWTAFERVTQVNRVNPDMWPPRVQAPVGSAQYHFSAMIDAVDRAYQIIRTEQDKANGIESPNTE